MSKRTILFLAVIVAISTVYDFYRGYHEMRSIISGIVYVIFGLIVLAFFWWLYSKRRNSN
jgi:cytochrome c biogenesis protein CcdA